MAFLLFSPDASTVVSFQLPPADSRLAHHLCSAKETSSTLPHPGKVEIFAYAPQKWTGGILFLEECARVLKVDKVEVVEGILAEVAEERIGNLVEGVDIDEALVNGKLAI